MYRHYDYEAEKEKESPKTEEVIKKEDKNPPYSREPNAFWAYILPVLNCIFEVILIIIALLSGVFFLAIVPIAFLWMNFRSFRFMGETRIRGIEIKVQIISACAFYSLLLFFDLFSNYWFIFIVAAVLQLVPLYIVGEYKPNKFFLMLSSPAWHLVSIILIIAGALMSSY